MSVWAPTIEDHVLLCKNLRKTDNDAKSWDQIKPVVPYPAWGLRNVFNSSTNILPSFVDRESEGVRQQKWHQQRRSDQDCSTNSFPFRSDLRTKHDLNFRRCISRAPPFFSDASLYQWDLHNSGMAHSCQTKSAQNKLCTTNCGFIQRRKKSPVCAFCKSNGEEFYKHDLKDENGAVVCPVLFSFSCKACGSSGAQAHTWKYCPLNPLTLGDPVRAGLPPGMPIT